MYLIPLLFALALITIIGHGIWVLLAKIFRAIFSEPEADRAAVDDRSDAGTRLRTRCAECGSALHYGDSFCPLCGLARSGAGRMAELAKIARQLDRFLNQGKLDAETHKLVMSLVEEERTRLIAPVRRDVVATRLEAEPLAPQPAPVEPASQQSPPALIEHIVSVVEEDVEKGVRNFDEIAAASADVPITVAEIQRQPRRSFTEMLGTFMEESSVRWGELVGGLLIIGCSIALVVSLWSQIAARPLLKFSVFIGVTTALFGLGFYSAHRWKLPTTSRGVLVISTLLAPLNFLAMTALTAFSREAVPPSPSVVGGELFSLALFFFLVYQAAKVFLPEAPWMTALATMGPSFAMLLARHSSVAENDLPRAALLGVAPLLCHCVSCGVILRDQAGRLKQAESDESRADQLFTHLGIASFSTLLPLGLLFINPGHFSQTLRQFAPLVSVFGIPAIATGVALLQWPADSQSGKTRTAATSVSLVGSLILLAALIFAWPNPVAVVITALINCAVSLAMALASSRQALRYDLRLAHASAIAHLSLAAMTAANLLSGNVHLWSEDGRLLAASLVSKESGDALALLFAFLLAASEWSLKIKRKIESRIYGAGAIVVGAFGLALITAHGFGRAGDPHHAAPVYVFYALAAFVIAWRREVVDAAWIGSALSLLAITQTLAFKFGDALAPYHPVRLSALIFANVATVAALIASLKSERARRLFARPCASSALIASVAVAPFLIFHGWMTTGQISTRMLWLAAIWLLIAWLKRSPVLFAAFQLALASSVVFGIAALFRHESPHSFVGDLRTIQAQAVALAMLNLAWIAARLALKRFGVVASVAESKKDEGEEPSRLFDPAAAVKLLYPGWPGVDRIVTLLLLGFLASLSLYGVHVGMIEALSPGWALSTESRDFAATALGAGSWSLLLSLSLVFIAGLWERFEKRVALAMLILLACACLLIAGRWGDARLTPAVYRWASAVAFAAVSSLIVARNHLARGFKRFGWPQMEERSKGLPAALRESSFVLFVAPVLTFSSLAFFKGIALIDASEFWPGRSGMIVGLVAPLSLVGLSFAAHAFRERSAVYACAAGLMVNLSATFGYLLWASARVWGIERTDAYTVAQLNIIATSICSLVWIWFHRRQTASGSAWHRSVAFLKTQTGLALFLSLSLLAVADTRLFIDPLIKSALANSFGGLTGLLAVALPMLAYAWLHEIKPDRLRAEHLGVGLIAIGSLLSCLMSRLWAGGWAASHTLGLALNASAWLMLALRRPVRMMTPVAQIVDQRSLEKWVTASALAIVAMILRGVSSSGEPWWTVGFSISTCLLLAGLSLASRRRGYIYLAAPILNYAATRVYLQFDLELSRLFSLDYIYTPGVVSLNAIVLALPSIAWLAIDLKLLRQNGAQSITPFHRVAARISLGLVSLAMLFQWSTHAFGSSQLIGEALFDWFALASVVTLFAACLWDERPAHALRGLHIAGLIVAAMALRSFNPGYERLLVNLVVILSLYALATSALFRRRESLARLAARLRMPLSVDDLARFSSWLNAMNLLLGVAAYAITFVVILSFGSLMQRLVAATASFAIPISMALLASASRNQSLITGKSNEAQNQHLITGTADQNANEQYISISIGQYDSVAQQASDNESQPDVAPISPISTLSPKGPISPISPISPINPNSPIGTITWMSLLSAILWGWAWLAPQPGPELQGINRLAVVMVVAGTILIGYRFIISRNLADENEWRRGVKAQLPIIGAIGFLALVAILSAEASNYASDKMAGAPWWVVIAVFAALVSLFLACIAFALSPGRDPFNLSERGRMNYVYGAEALTVVTMLHARVTIPWFFGGFFLTWWPLVVMLLAFTGVGLSELFRRRGRLVLAEPLERTGILLPILPVFGFWLEPSQVSYSGLLFLVGLFYGALSVMRRSFGFGILAVFAGNGGLWKLLDGVEGYGFYQHPQLWLIPVSLSVLAAGHINRDQLTKDQMTMIRYATLMMIYVSSTSDIFINGVSESPWLTMILLVLSVIGVLAGLALRIRAFLFLGTSFLLLSLLAIIWTASVNLKWGGFWPVVGIAFGVLIIISFALFEKKRREMLELVERLKQWQA